MTGVSLLVIALALAAVLSIVAGSPGDDRGKQLVTELTDIDSADDDPSSGPSGDLGR